MAQDDKVELLLQALENENNNSIIQLDSSKIKTIKNNILQKLQLSGKQLKHLHKKLKYYRYCMIYLIYSLEIILDGYH